MMSKRAKIGAGAALSGVLAGLLALFFTTSAPRVDKATPLAPQHTAVESKSATVTVATSATDSQKMAAPVTSKCQAINDVATPKQRIDLDQWKLDTGLYETNVLDGERHEARSGYQAHSQKALEAMIRAGDTRAMLVYAQRDITFIAEQVGTADRTADIKLNLQELEKRVEADAKLLERAYIEGGFGIAPFDASGLYALLAMAYQGYDYSYGPTPYTIKPEAMAAYTTAIRKGRAYYRLAEKSIPQLPSENTSLIASIADYSFPDDPELAPFSNQLLGRITEARRELGKDLVHQPIPDTVVAALKNTCDLLPGMVSAMPAPAITSPRHDMM